MNMHVSGGDFAGFNIIIKEELFKQVIFEQRLEEVEVGEAICKSIGECSQRENRKCKVPKGNVFAV